MRPISLPSQRPHVHMTWLFWRDPCPQTSRASRCTPRLRLGRAACCSCSECLRTRLLAASPDVSHCPCWARERGLGLELGWGPRGLRGPSMRSASTTIVRWVFVEPRLKCMGRKGVRVNFVVSVIFLRFYLIYFNDKNLTNFSHQF